MSIGSLVFFLLSEFVQLSFRLPSHSFRLSPPLPLFSEESVGSDFLHSHVYSHTYSTSHVSTKTFVVVVTSSIVGCVKSMSYEFNIRYIC
jgi:hypothetical protein